MYFGCDITKKDRNTEIRVNFGEFRGISGGRLQLIDFKYN